MTVRVFGCDLRTGIMSGVMTACKHEPEREGAIVC